MNLYSHLWKSFIRNERWRRNLLTKILFGILVDYNKKTNATLVISSHDLNHITDISHRVALIEKGLIIRDLQNDGSALAQLENYFSV